MSPRRHCPGAATPADRWRVSRRRRRCSSWSRSRCSRIATAWGTTGAAALACTMSPAVAQAPADHDCARRLVQVTLLMLWRVVLRLAADPLLDDAPVLDAGAHRRRPTLPRRRADLIDARVASRDRRGGAARSRPCRGVGLPRVNRRAGGGGCCAAPAVRDRNRPHSVALVVDVEVDAGPGPTRSGIDVADQRSIGAAPADDLALARSLIEPLHDAVGHECHLRHERNRSSVRHASTIMNAVTSKAPAGAHSGVPTRRCRVTIRR